MFKKLKENAKMNLKSRMKTYMGDRFKYLTHSIVNDLQWYYQRDVKKMNMEVTKQLSEGFGKTDQAEVEKVLCEIEADYNAFST